MGFAAEEFLAAVTKRPYSESNMNDFSTSLIAFAIILIVCLLIAIAYYAGLAAVVYLVLKAVGAPIP